MKQISVSLLNHSYNIVIDPIDDLRNVVPQSLHGQSAIIITDDIVEPLYAEIIRAKFVNVFSKIEIIAIKGGESAKSLDVFSTLCEIIGDLVGFVAASLLRGIPFIQIPTTLLAQVDSSVGGKTGLNSSEGKNLIGAFYQPRVVLIFTEFLKTLPIREMRAGYAEILKYGLLGNKNFYEDLLSNGQKIFEYDRDYLNHVISISCAMKADIVARDEFETNDIRALLNLGHTFAHAIETLCGYDGRILHGEAVAIGLVCAAQLSHNLGYITNDDVMHLDQHLKGLGFMTRLSDVPHLKAKPDDYIVLMRHDKKAEQHKLVFVLLNNIGEAFVDRTVTEDQVKEVLKWAI
jgi:3-dehydroquinate synthase